METFAVGWFICEQRNGLMVKFKNHIFALRMKASLSIYVYIVLNDIVCVIQSCVKNDVWIMGVLNFKQVAR